MRKKDELIVKSMKAMPWLGLVLVCILGAVGKEVRFGAEQLADGLLCATLILAILSWGVGNLVLPLILSVCSVVSFSLSALPFIGRVVFAGFRLRTLIPVAVTIVLTQVDISVRTAARYRNIRTLFKNAMVVDSISVHAYMHRTLVLYSACIIMVMASGSDRHKISVILFLAASVILFVLCVLTLRSPQRMLFVGKNRYLQLVAMARGRLKDNLLPEEAEESDMKRTYARVLECMEKSKLYLDPDLSLEDMARALGTNKVYLSRTVNVVSGRNFCQFVNYYRVQYAKDIMRKDPHSRMMDVAIASGFHSIVTFNMAFKVNEDTTPSEWMREYASIS